MLIRIRLESTWQQKSKINVGFKRSFVFFYKPSLVLRVLLKNFHEFIKAPGCIHPFSLLYWRYILTFDSTVSIPPGRKDKDWDYVHIPSLVEIAHTIFVFISLYTELGHMTIPKGNWWEGVYLLIFGESGGGYFWRKIREQIIGNYRDPFPQTLRKKLDRR